MNTTLTSMTVAGKFLRLPTVCIADRTVMVRGKWARVATVQDADWQSGESVADPPGFLRQLRASGLAADWFTFAQKFTDTKPHHPYHWEWDNVAALPLSTYEEWWETFVVHDLRKNVKRAKKRGVEVRVVPFDEALVRGIKAIYDETPVRQGRLFWHYGKPLDQVWSENATYPESSEFLGAYLGEQLIGFVKLVYVDASASMMQILSLASQHQLYITNALIAKCVEVTVARACAYLIYGKYTYGNKRRSSVVRFKRDHGFEQILYPRYYVPLTVRGRVMLAAGVHRGYRRFIPESLVYALLRVRSKMLVSRSPTGEAVPVT